MRKGFTTGSCAAAAAKAAAYMLITGNVIDKVSILTPSGIAFDAEILDVSLRTDKVSCAVRKDGGDDPDVTTGALVYAEVSYKRTGTGVFIDGGPGVGRVTRPGLDQPVGAAAINSVPRQMITDAVMDVIESFDCGQGMDVIISVPGGEEIASHTFNPRLGVEGGISIIGTSGIVEPMSRQAILDTIRIELKQKYAEGCEIAFISPGNYGLDFMKSTYDVDLDRSVKCSNFIGETIDMIVETGFRGVLLTGHAGKLVKVAGGIMNTHSREADGRMEIISASALRNGVDREAVLRILDSLTTEEAFSILKEAGHLRDTADLLMEKIIYYLDKRAKGNLDIQCIMYTKDLGLLSASIGAEEMIHVNKVKWNER